MDEAIQQFQRYLLRRYPKGNTTCSYISDLRVFQRFVDKPPREVTRHDIARFVEHQLAQGLAAKTVNRRLACLHHFFEFLAVEREEENWPNPVVWHSQRVQEGHPLPRDLSDAQVEQLFAGIDQPRDRLLLGLMCWAGLRVGEVVALRISDLIPSPSGPRLRVQGKGQKERIVPLTAELSQQWAQWLEQRPETDSDQVFITRRGQGFSVRGVQERVEHYAQQAGIAVHCHQLRHTFGRRLAEGAMPVLSLSKVLGHTSVSTTQLYIVGAGVDVRADYEAAMRRLESAREVTVPPPVPPVPEPVAPSVAPPSGPGGTGAEASPAETADSSAEVDWSRYWQELPIWLQSALEEYIAFQQRRWKPSQVYHHTRTRLQNLRQVWRWLVQQRGVSHWESLHRADVQAYLDQRVAAGVAASTLNRELRDLWAFLRYWTERGAPLASGVFRIPRLKEGEPLPRFLGEAEYARLEEHVLRSTAGGSRDDCLDRAWFYLLAHQGLRLCELCDLRLSDVDLAGQRLWVRAGKGNRDRALPLSAATKVALSHYLAVRGLTGSEALLVQRQQALRPGWVQSQLHRYGQAVGVQVSPHRLRHTLATRLVNVGMDIVSIQHVLGHESLDTTRIYARVYDTTVEREFYQAMARLETHVEAYAFPLPWTVEEGSASSMFSGSLSLSVTDSALDCV